MYVYKEISKCRANIYIYSAVIDSPHEMTSPIAKKKALALAEYWCHKSYVNPYLYSHQIPKWFVFGSCIIPGR